MPLACDTIVTARQMGICFGDEPPGHFIAAGSLLPACLEIEPVALACATSEHDVWHRDRQGAVMTWRRHASCRDGLDRSLTVAVRHARAKTGGDVDDL